MRSFIITSLTFITIALSSLGANTPTTWKAAAASAKITPETMMWMAGYTNRTKPADSVTLDLFAKLLVLEDSTGQRLLMITMDFIGVPKSLHDSLVQRMEKEQGIKPAFILINAFHTHSAFR